MYLRPTLEPTPRYCIVIGPSLAQLATFTHPVSRRRSYSARTRRPWSIQRCSPPGFLLLKCRPLRWFGTPATRSRERCGLGLNVKGAKECGTDLPKRRYFPHNGDTWAIDRAPMYFVGLEKLALQPSETARITTSETTLPLRANYMFHGWSVLKSASLRTARERTDTSLIRSYRARGSGAGILRMKQREKKATDLTPPLFPGSASE